MNNQLSVATVVNMDTLQSLAREFKQRFELSSGLIHEKLAGKEFIFNHDGKDTYPFAGWSEACDGELHAILPVQEQVTIASTDSSCILLGESFEGAVYAVRAAVTFSCAGPRQGLLPGRPHHRLPLGEGGLRPPRGPRAVRAARGAHRPPDRGADNQERRRAEDSLDPRRLPADRRS